MNTSTRLVPVLLCLAAWACATQVNVRTQYGAAGNGVTDDTLAFQRALDDMRDAGGGKVYAPRGNYRINATLSVPRNVTLKGVASSPTAWTQYQCTTLLAYAGRDDATGTPFLSLTGDNAALKGLTIFYPEQVKDTKPIPYPWCIDSATGDNHAILDCQLVNPYNGIRLHGANRHLVRDVQGQPFHIGLSVDDLDHPGRVENVHFWPFGVNHPWNGESVHSQWMREHSVGFEFGRAPGQMVINTFCFAYGIGYRFFGEPDAGMHGSLLGIGADWCRVGMQVEQCHPAGLLITNGQFVGNWGNEAFGLRVLPECRGLVSVMNSSFWGASVHIAVMEGSGRLSFRNCQFKEWDKHRRNDYAIVHLAGSLSVQGCQFWSAGNDVYLGADARAAFLIGNEAKKHFRVMNKIGSRAEMLLNTGWQDVPLLELGP